MESRRHHIILLTFPVQSHINPALHFAKHLLLTGAHVTYAISVSAHRRMQTTSSPPDGLTFAPFSDGFDDGFKLSDPNYMPEFERHCSKFVTDLAANLAKEGNPITCIFYSLPMPWAARLARKLGVPSALLWIQPATVFDLYYYYFHGYKTVMASDQIELPGLPLLTRKDVPSFFLESNDLNTAALHAFQEQLETLEQETKPWVLVNTFDALEHQALRAIGSKLNLIGIGPLLPLASDKSFRADLFHGGSKDYIEWLNSKKDASVVYVSFGSLAELSKAQMEAIANGLLESHRPFLWVIRGGSKEVETKLMDRLEELNGEGLIVPWCSQVEVLSHPSVGCFVTHCGWNSTLEVVAAGVPMVAFPQCFDQPTNAKLIEEVWRTGVRVKVSDEDGEGMIVKSEEIVRCLEVVMGEESGEEMRKNAKRWSVLAREAVKEGGSSDTNIRAFMKELGAGAGAGASANLVCDN